MRVIQFEMLCFGRGVDVDVVTFMRWYSMMANKVHQIANDRCRSSVFRNIFQELRGYVIIGNMESFNYNVIVYNYSFEMAKNRFVMVTGPKNVYFHSTFLVRKYKLRCKK